MFLCVNRKNLKQNIFISILFPQKNFVSFLFQVFLTHNTESLLIKLKFKFWMFVPFPFVPL